VPAETGALGATVVHVELLGHETLVHADVDGVRLIARVDGMVAAKPGATVHLRLDPAALHFFDDAGAALIE
jgi:multiple sugar transport system ATP-binding protein